VSKDLMHILEPETLIPKRLGIDSKPKLVVGRPL
jgi:hypothetical protein